MTATPIADDGHEPVDPRIRRSLDALNGAQIDNVDGQPVDDATAAGLEPGTVELISMDPPLLKAAKRRLTQQVVLHVIGGMQLDGTLESIEDDLTLVVTDRANRYDIALASVAVIEGSRRG